MPSPRARRRRSTTCAITRNPAAGQTGITSVILSLNCTPPYPASPEQWELGVAFNGWEIQTDDSALIKDKDVLTTAAGQVFTVERQKRYPAHNGRDGFCYLLLMERGA